MKKNRKSMTNNFHGESLNQQNAAARGRVCPCRGLQCGNGLTAFFKEVQS